MTMSLVRHFDINISDTPAVGIILGIVYLTKEKPVDKKLGEHLIAFSILFGIIQVVLVSTRCSAPKVVVPYYLNY